MLYKVGNKKKTAPDEAPTIQQAVILIAKIGGYPGRKHDPLPGLEVIWRGLTTIDSIIDASQYLS